MNSHHPTGYGIWEPQATEQIAHEFMKETLARLSLVYLPVLYQYCMIGNGNWKPCSVRVMCVLQLPLSDVL